MRILRCLPWLILPFAAVEAQEVPRDQYLRYLPLSTPRLVRAAPATAAANLYGDTAAPGYTDVTPRDGIDDARGRLLMALGVRFAPVMMRNTADIPLDVRQVLAFQDRSAVIVDRWNTAGPVPSLMHADTVDLRAGMPPCLAPAGGDADTVTSLRAAAGPIADCQLLTLLRRFDPGSPADPGTWSGAADPDVRPFTVLFVDPRGADVDGWRREYLDRKTHRLRAEYGAMAHAFVHPFARTVDSTGYELVLQYWLYYPTNDGANKHEGDWEHINVIVGPRSAVTAPLTMAALQAMLARPPDRLDGDDPLVIRRVDYLFHHSIMQLDYARPNVYRPRDEWDRERAEAARSPERLGQDAMAKDIRARAWQDTAETVVNTHPVVYIGGNSKGLELLLSWPGARNRNSHGSFPFPGLYKTVGPGASEEIHKRGPASAQRLDDPARLTLIPDWERLLPAIREDAGMRAAWAWLVLPIHWGYPAMASPLAGIVSNAETGNLAPLGPAYLRAWNTAQPIAGFSAYSPHRVTGTIAITPQDAFRNSLGFANAPIAGLTALPPIDLLYKLFFGPVRHAVGGGAPTYFAAAARTYPLITVGGGLTQHSLGNRTWPVLLLQTGMLGEIENRLRAMYGDDLRQIFAVSSVAGESRGPLAEVTLALGSHWSTVSSLHYARSDLELLVGPLGPTPKAVLRGRLTMWEYAGALRYGPFTGRLRPFARVGYGLSWYKVEEATMDGVRLTARSGDWIRRPSLTHNLLPNTWHYGIGAEAAILRENRMTGAGTDLILRADAAIYNHSLGTNDRARFLPSVIPPDGVRRFALTVTAALGF